MSGEQLRNFAILGSASDLQNLLSGGANPCSIDDKGLTALHYATWNDHVECVKLLLANDCGRNATTGEACSAVNIRSTEGYTALHIAALSGGENAACCCRMLLLCGANVGVRDEDGLTPLDVARRKGLVELVEMMESRVLKEDVDEFWRRVLEEYRVPNRRPRNGGNSRSDNDEDDSSVALQDRRERAMIPKELDMHEHLILPTACKVFRSGSMDRSAGSIRMLADLLDMAERNVDRRETLVNSRIQGEWTRPHFPSFHIPDKITDK